MTDTSSNLLTGSQKVIGSIPIFSTDYQRVAIILQLFLFAYNLYLCLILNRYCKFKLTSFPLCTLNM